jgi:aryl-alcohol dehydrogenase-like predicted oxidoreductase
LNDNSERITKVVIAIADELGVSAGNVALQWMRQQGFSCIPIVGATKQIQLQDNLKPVIYIKRSDHLKKLDDASAITLGFPGDFFKEEGVRINSFGGFYDRVEKRI